MITHWSVRGACSTSHTIAKWKSQVHQLTPSWVAYMMLDQLSSVI